MCTVSQGPLLCVTVSLFYCVICDNNLSHRTFYSRERVLFSVGDEIEMFIYDHFLQSSPLSLWTVNASQLSQCSVALPSLLFLST